MLEFRPMINVEASVPRSQVADLGGGIFLRLDQRPNPLNGTRTFAIPPKEERLRDTQPRQWLNALPPLYREQFLTDRQNLYTILRTNDLHGISHFINNPSPNDSRRESRIERETKANRKVAEHYHLSGSDSEIAERIRKYAGQADETVIRLAKELDRPVLFELTNEVASTQSILDLIGMVFDERSDERTKFEAVRKLTLMEVFAVIDQHEREETEREIATLSVGKTEEDRERIAAMYRLQGADRNYYHFQQFLDDFVFKSKVSGGDRMGVLKSIHDETNFATVSVTKLPKKQAEIARYRKPKKGEKYTEIGERTFEQDGKQYLVYSKPRKKDSIATALKMIRKATMNPGGIQDSIGLLAVLPDRASIDAFMARLRAGAAEAGRLFEIEESEDTLDGNPYSAKNPGSSKDLRAFKFIVRIGSLEVEGLIFHHIGWADNLYRDDVSHNEFNIKRYYESSLAQWFFPQEIYEEADHRKIEISARQKIRARNRGITS